MPASWVELLQPEWASVDPTSVLSTTPTSLQQQQHHHHQRDDQPCLIYLHVISLVATPPPAAPQHRTLAPIGALVVGVLRCRPLRDAHVR